ncbi:hypothetical protein DUI87_27375 [Hirundo rustica rustica]|uniref:CCHC-type domain-containing protein n=1 Tax=Hirundo rustica rustica TaxID=333673 RepID=A0A3M0JBA8_HIRRU|nr:hypothetical protein DUI87_27375 [Hirundo rustica rustica]
MGRSDDGNGEAKMEDGLYPLRKVPMTNPEQSPIGDVSVLLNTGDVREFKKEMGRLLEDPLGMAERLDQFLRPNIYTWVELQSILGILFTMEEREMIRYSGMRVWDRECQGPDQGDQKWPMQDPGWNNQNERHRQNRRDLRWMIIQGIREVVPKGQNIRKAPSEHQGKDEPLADWLERLRKALYLYSGVDPDTAAGQVLLKTQFVAKSWGHIRKKLEKVENWQDRGLQELLREAQKVYVRRDEERQKTKTQILMAAVKETQTTMNTEKRSGKNKQQKKAGPTSGETRSTCFSCHQKGHLQTSCPTSRVIGVKGEVLQVPVIKNVQNELDKKFGPNDLVLIPEADNNLLGRDLIIALGIKITPCEGNLKIYSLTEEDNFEISDTVWYTGEVGKLNIQPVSIEIQNPEIPIRVKQYLISLEGRKGLKPVVENSVHQGVLESCVSPHNTPILPVKKPDGSYRLVQDLRAVNQRTITRFPGVAKPNTS